MATILQQQTPIRIHLGPLEERKDENGNVYFYGADTQVQSTAGISQTFTVAISGQLDDLTEFGEQTVFTDLTLIELIDVRQTIEDQQADRRDALQQKWHDRLDAAHKIINTATIEELSDRYLLCDKIADAKQMEQQPKPVPDLTQDRVIEITPNFELEKGRSYKMAYTLVSPRQTVHKGQSDYYNYQNTQADRASAGATVDGGEGGGDVDLYLFLDGNEKDRSTAFNNLREYVEGVGAPGGWRLQVYGYKDSQYTLQGSWIRV